MTNEMNEWLKSRLSHEDYAKHLVAVALEIEAAYQRGRDDRALMPWLRGALRSVTVWLGGALIVSPEALSELEPHLRDSLGPDSYKRLVQLAGIMVILARLRTRQSLKEKGAQIP